jgi:hypothetical protein
MATVSTSFTSLPETVSTLIARHQPARRSRGGHPAPRQQRAAAVLLLQSQRQRGGSQDRHKTVTRVGEVEVRGLPEGVVFSPDGQYIYVGNYMDRDVSILKVEKNGQVVNTGKSLKLPGQPASMRGAK